MILIGLGLFSSLTDSGMFGSFWFALLLVGGGIYLLNRSRERDDRPRPTPTPPASGPSAPPVTAASPPPVVATPPAPSGFAARSEMLEAWRSAQAEAEGRAPYLIITDATLALLAEHNPSDLEGVRRVKGIGPVKLERYGESLLEVLRNADT